MKFQQNKAAQRQRLQTATSHKQQQAASSARPLQKAQQISQSNLPEQVILPMHLIQHGRVGHQVIQKQSDCYMYQRGYIVEGGYRLRKARIEMGKASTNLYATSTKSALIEGIGESALPFYIVTIDCKTMGGSEEVDN